MSRKQFIILMYIFSTFFLFSEDLIFVSVENLVEQEVGRIVLPEIYSKLNLRIHITPEPGLRAKVMAINGKVDGEIMRVLLYGEDTDSVVRIPTPYYYLETMPFVMKESGITINTITDLNELVVGRVRGVVHTEEITRNLKNVKVVNSTKQMFHMLKNGRIDVALTNTIDGRKVLMDDNIKGIVYMDKPLGTHNLYNYLHIKNRYLVRDVDQMIIEMRDSGELEQLIESAENSVLGVE